MKKSAKHFTPLLQVKIIVPSILICIILNLLARFSTPFADFFTDNIFINISVPFGFLTSLIPFSLGELLIFIGILLLIIGIPLFIIAMIKCKDKREKIACNTALFLGWVLVYVLFTETVNCFIHYQCTVFSDRYFPDYPKSGYSVQQLTDMCEDLISHANELSAQLERDDKGEIILPDDIGKRAAEHMRSLSDEYSRLGGWYPSPKKIFFSRIMSKLELQGIYFPFTMEANYNAHMKHSKVPCTICHELTHAKGFILEDEASFIAYIACAESGDPLFMYSGYLSAMNRSLNQLYTCVSQEEYARIYSLMNTQVRQDSRFLNDEYKASLEQDKLIKKETAAKVSDKAMDITLKANGVTDGKDSYGRMVDLLLMYYYN